MHYLFYLLDFTVVLAAIVSAWFWLQASGKPLRRISKFEDFDHADLNRVVIALNRARILNARAATATAVAALLAGLRIAIDLVP